MSPKRAILSLAAASGLAALARRASRRHLRILCYHGLWVLPGEPFGECLFITPEQFDARMARLRRSGVPLLGLGEAVRRLAKGDLPPRATVVTIDDGWVSTHSHMLPILERHEVPATLYSTTWYSERDLPVVNVAVAWMLAAAGRPPTDCAQEIARIEGLPEEQRLAALRALGATLGLDEAWLETRQFHLMRPDELADARRRGLDIQLHTHRHINVTSQIGRLGEEIDANRASLEAMLDGPVLEHFCYPSGTWHPDAAAILAAKGVRSATLVTEGLNAPDADAYALRRLLDGRHVGDVEFDAYLSGTLHYLSELRGLAGAVRGLRRTERPVGRAPAGYIG